MPRLEGRELLLLKGAGGERFADFVDRLIRAEAHVGGLPQSEIDTQVRANIGDGGVDTRVRAAVPNDHSGFLAEPTCWQYKAETLSELKARGTDKDPLRFLTVEVNKPEVQRLVGVGFAFRFCLLGDLTPAEASEWESHLLTLCQKISATPAMPRVVAADKLIAWAERFPSVGSRVRPFPQEIFNLATWGNNARAVTPEYVVPANWAPTSKAILYHVGAENVVDPCLSIQGEAGVGKTRLVFETLSTLMGAGSLVMYTRDDRRACALSEQLANDPALPNAIVVADECSIQQRFTIAENIRGCSARVRFICLSNTGERSPSGVPERWLEELPRETVDKILQRNFPDVPSERRSAYADLAGGFIRLSADMCAHNHELSAVGDLTPVLSHVIDYIKYRLHDSEEENVLSAIALFTRLGAKGDVASELRSVCEIIGTQPALATEIAERMKDSPGFIVVAGRFLYVTPAIVARVAFERGWKKWVKDDPTDFIQRLHPALIAPFLERVRSSATEEVRAAMAAFFRGWIAAWQPEYLANAAQVAVLCRIVETDPERYLPLLRNLIADTGSKPLRSGLDSGRSPRRDLVWLCERLAAFPEHYNDSEEILFKLAVEESEPSIGNNATGIWCQLQRIFLSGTSVPFEQRFQIFRRRSEGAENAAFDLCMKAIKGIFEPEAMRVFGAATVGGRLRPADWQPRTHAEHSACWRLTLQLLNDLAVEKNEEKASRAADLAVESIYRILDAGFLDELVGILTPSLADGHKLPRIMEHVEQFLHWKENDTDSEAAPDNPAEASYRERVRTWLQATTPTDFGGRLHTLISRSQWDESLRDVGGDLNSKLVKLASEVCSNPEIIKPEIQFLTSDAAKSAILFGHALGRCDVNEAILPIVFSAVTPGSNISLAQGYVFGYMRRRDSVGPALQDWISRIAAANPLAAFDLRCVGGERLGAFEYGLQGVDRGELPAASLSRFAFDQNLSIPRIKEVLRRLLVPSRNGADVSADAAVHFLASLLHAGRGSTGADSIRDEEVRRFAWEALQLSSDTSRARDAYERGQILERLAEYDARRSASLLLKTALTKGYVTDHDYELRSLVAIAPAHPTEVMDALGSALLDQKQGLALSIGEGALNLLRALPARAVIDWIRRTGIEGAKAVARELPVPRVDNDGNAVVPEVTLAVLGEFGDENDICEQFLRRAFRSDSWWGNGGNYFRAKAAAGRRFLGHENRCIRRWAEEEVSISESNAEREQLRHDEREL